MDPDHEPAEGDADADVPAAARPPAKEPLILQVLDKMSQLMVAALGFVAALAWNEAIKAAISTYLPGGTGVRSLFVYALSVTLVAVLFGLWIAWLTNRAKTRLEKIKLEGLRLELLKQRLSMGRRGREPPPASP